MTAIDIHNDKIGVFSASLNQMAETTPLSLVTSAIQGGAASGPFLPLSGGTLTGSLVLAHDPTGALEAASKEYVDSNITTKAVLVVPSTVFYVAPSGNDYNPGTNDQPFATIQGAVNYISRFYSTGVTIHVAAGTYGAVSINGGNIRQWVITGSGDTTCFIQNNDSTLATFSGIAFTVSNGATVFASGFTFSSYSNCVEAVYSSTLNLWDCGFAGSTTGCAIASLSSSNVILLWEVSGGSNLTSVSHLNFYNTYTSAIVTSDNATCQVGYAGGPEFAEITFNFISATFTLATVYADSCSAIIFSPSAVTWGGVPNGPRYYAATFSSIKTAGSGTSWIPGTSPGTVNNGLYI